MMFSQRIGEKAVRSIIQLKSMDNNLRTAIWNQILLFYFNMWSYSYLTENSDSTVILFRNLWIYFYKKCFDEIPMLKRDYLTWMKLNFFTSPWYEVYDLLEFIASEDKKRGSEFRIECNKIFQNELSGYRFVNNYIIPLTSEEEIESIENALTIPDRFFGVKKHLNRSLELLSDKKNQDYRNSIKESISAVESLCKVIVGKDNAILPDALKEIEKNGQIHNALKQSFINMYGYTSDSDGIRHALLEEDKLKQEDAIFMLISCSAFINYLISKDNNK